MPAQDRSSRRLDRSHPSSSQSQAGPATVPGVPAATAVVVRDGDGGLEVLMVRRNAALAFAGGNWVFPGGRIDPDDHRDLATAPEDPAVLDAAARRAAVRETQEECGLVLDPDELVWFSHWTPPPASPKRFLTWFFVAPAPVDHGQLVVDGGEIHDAAWFRPGDALAAHNRRELALQPPTWITLEHLGPLPDAATALSVLGQHGPEHFATRIVELDGSSICLYHGDAGYELEDAGLPGARHRLWMVPGAWRYERDQP